MPIPRAVLFKVNKFKIVRIVDHGFESRLKHLYLSACSALSCTYCNGDFWPKAL
jgi:hypothetical protein